MSLKPDGSNTNSTNHHTQTNEQTNTNPASTDPERMPTHS